MKLEEIESVWVHWSESTLINEVLGCDDNSDIEKSVDVFEFNDLIKAAASEVESGYDKTVLTITLIDGLEWCTESKFYLTSDRDTLIKLIRMEDSK